MVGLSYKSVKLLNCSSVLKLKSQKMKIAVLLVIVVQSSAGFNPVHRIHGGHDVNPGTIPSFVALEAQFETSVKHCGGVLGSPGDRIFTAASCVYE